MAAFSYLLAGVCLLVVACCGYSKRCSCDSSDGFIRVSDSLCFKNVYDGDIHVELTWMFGEDVNETDFLDAKDFDGNTYFRLNEHSQRYETVAPLPCGGVLIISGDVSILFDTGIGEVDPFLSPQKTEGVTSVYKDLHDIGCGDIDVVVSSHLHWDHVGWNIRYNEQHDTAESDSVRKYVPSFDHPTVFYVQNDEYYYWKRYTLSQDDDPGIKQTMKQMASHVDTLVDAGQIALRFGDYYLTKDVEVKRCIGHTPGHQCVYLYDAEKRPRVMLIGDTTHTPYQVTKPQMSSVWDFDMELAAQTRLNLVEYAYNHSMLFAPAHYSGMGVIKKCEAGDLCQSPSGYVWRPLSDDGSVQNSPPKSEI